MTIKNIGNLIFLAIVIACFYIAYRTKPVPVPQPAFSPPTEQWAWEQFPDLEPLLGIVQHKWSSCMVTTVCSLGLSFPVKSGATLVYSVNTDAGILNRCTDTQGNKVEDGILNLSTQQQRMDFVKRAKAGDTWVTCTSTKPGNIRMKIMELGK